jgi:hypothetical protein
MIIKPSRLCRKQFKADSLLFSVELKLRQPKFTDGKAVSPLRSATAVQISHRYALVPGKILLKTAKNFKASRKPMGLRIGTTGRALRLRFI